MHSNGENIKIMVNDKADEVIKKLFESLKKRYQSKLLESMRGSDFSINHAHLLYYKFHKINQNPGGSYIYSADWIKNTKAIINPINKNDKKYFQYILLPEYQGTPCSKQAPYLKFK